VFKARGTLIGLVPDELAVAVPIPAGGVPTGAQVAVLDVMAAAPATELLVNAIERFGEGNPATVRLLSVIVGTPGGPGTTAFAASVSIWPEPKSTCAPQLYAAPFGTFGTVREVATPGVSVDGASSLWKKIVPCGMPAAFRPQQTARYPRICAPLVLPGVNVTVICPLPGVAETFVGADGGGGAGAEPDVEPWAVAAVDAPKKLLSVAEQL
jgi:hypothetical protein